MSAPRRWGQVKPPFGTRLDPTQPGFKGLYYALPLNDKSGQTAFNEPQYYDRSVTLYSTAAMPSLGSATTVKFDNGGLLYTSSTTSFLDCGQNDRTTGELSWIAHCKPTSFAALVTIFGQNTSGGDESVDSIYLESTKLTWWIYSGSSEQVLNGTATLEVNKKYRFAGRRSGASGAWSYTTWIDEVPDDTNTTTGNHAVRAGDGNLRVGFAGAYTGAPFVGTYDCFFLWRRALPTEELLGYSRNPYNLYLPRPLSVAVPPPAAPAGGNRRRRLLMACGG